LSPAERAIADVLTFRRFWGGAWALERIETAALEVAYERQHAPHREHRQRHPPSR